MVYSNPRIAVLQLSTPAQGLETHLLHIEQWVQQAAQQGAGLVVLPEAFALMTQATERIVAMAERYQHGPLQSFLAALAKRYRVWVVGGTLPIWDRGASKPYARCLIYDDQGCEVAYYDKIHLFDATVVPRVETYRESSYHSAGRGITVVPSPFGRLGIAVCYDLRFAQQFNQMAKAGAELLIVPAAFTRKTGQAHFETLLKARAIENVSYLATANQTGQHEPGLETYGHSMIISPWGESLAALQDEVGIAVAEIDLARLQQWRRDLPVLAHPEF